jgi:secreted trypsin-like serine protease
MFAAGASADEFRMQSIPDSVGASPKILNGARAERADWTATLLFTAESGELCTATIIGDQILMTAAHCVVQNPSGTVVWNNRNVRVQCTMHPDYDDQPLRAGGLPCHLRVYSKEIAACTADIALCRTGEGATFSQAVGRFERVKASAPSVLVHESVAMLGYGCTSESTKTTGELSIGPAEVMHVSVPGASADPSKTFDEFIQTKGAGTCYGDSGGAAYTSSDPKSREIIGVNSRGNLTSGSALVNVKDPRIAKFLTDFSSSNGALICGLDQKATNCAF